MKKIDPRLRHVLRQREQPMAMAAAAVLADHVGLTEAAGPEPEMVEVLLRCEGRDAADRLLDVGMRVHTSLPGAVSIVSGEIPLDSLHLLNELPFVRQIEASRPMVSELDVSRGECGIQPLHDANPAVRGQGAVVGIVDGGIDFTHPDFRNADGTSRILFLWDQSGAPAAGAQVPFGREYTRAQIDEALAAGDPFSRVPHRDRGGHGTHVAGIAAGGDRNGVGFDGVAPEADLIVVATASPEGGVTLARSARVFQAFPYIVDRAGGRPVAINQSQGMNGGGHSGETVLETGMDLLARRPGVAIVKSAGNEQLFNIHAGGTLTQGETRALRLSVEANNRADDVIEIWMDGASSVHVALRPPGGVRTDFVAPGGDGVFDTLSGNEVTIDSDLDADETGDLRFTIVLARGSVFFIQPGEWEILLRADQIADGRFDAWIERANRLEPGEQTRFAAASADPSRTISTPGTARRVITVGSYVTRPGTDSPAPGQISSFSSRGPTRYGLRKPEICAPGERISSARSSSMTSGSGAHRLERGTSMAAPHVTGAAALVLSVNPGLHGEQVQQILARTARRTGAAASAPDDVFGNGRLGADAAVALARTVRFPRVEQVSVTGTTVQWNTDVPTTGAVLFNPHRRRMQLGRSSGSVAALVPSTNHLVDLSHLAAGTYFLEVRAFDEDNFWTAEDNGGELFELTVP